MKRYSKVNNICGWSSFLIAAYTYLSTVEPTASFWDCSEFISSSFKFEVGHPPGAPFFMLMAKFFTLFASDTAHVAIMVNRMSALMSAATILFLFWTITYFAKRLVWTDKTKEMTMGQLIIIMGSGFVGALAYTFSDSFWFSAVEGEVYATSAMFTALVFWLILKWERSADKAHSDRWLVFMAYCMGLSIGVHLLNLLCVPAIVLVYYYKKNEKTTVKGVLLSLAVSFGLIAILMFGIIPGFTTVGAAFELFFVNTLHFSYNSGSFIYLILLIGLIIWSLIETMSPKGDKMRGKISFFLAMLTAGVPIIGDGIFLWVLLTMGLFWFVFLYKKIDRRVLNTSALCLLVILMGYSSFAMLPIRSIANTPLDEDSPENVFSLREYLNRDQYGSTPLVYGQTYASEIMRDKDGNAVVASTKNKYGRVIKKSPNEPDQYVITSSSDSYKYTNTTLFPRMYADKTQPGFNNYWMGYKSWGGAEDPTIPPTMFQEIRYFVSYQLNFMYFRYFMWNFSGRQNDKQNRGGLINGNWITGISFIDNHFLHLGPQDNLPDSIIHNKAHNVYYGLPFLLGLLGLAFQLRRKKRGEQQFLIVFMLFFMTGIAIVLYLNQKPFEPRERDYAYAGSFYAYAIWIGLGVAGLWHLLKKLKVNETGAAALATLVTVLIPIQMGSQNWDDHDRSGRYTMRDFGKNYLMSCKPNAIVFTNGDNDTFPLWYLQEVEGYRTDVRVCNLSYLQTDWYVEQMRREAYESKPLPILWDESHYTGDKGQAAYIINRKNIDHMIEQSVKKDQGDNYFAKLHTIDYSKIYDTSIFKDTVSLDFVMTNLRTHDKWIPKNPFVNETDDRIQYVVPSSILEMPVDTAKVNWAELGSKPAPKMYLNFGEKKNAVYRQELMIMEMLNNINKDNWKRPIYFAVTIGPDMYMNLDASNNLMLEGLTYRIVPGQATQTAVNTDVAYDNMVNKFVWGGADNPKVYLDENNLNMCYTFRLMFSQLINALILEKKPEKALLALNKCMTVLPITTVPANAACIPFARYYFELGQPDKGAALLKAIEDGSNRSLTWFNRLSTQQMWESASDMKMNFNTLLEASLVKAEYNKDAYKDDMAKYLKLAQFYYGINFPYLGDLIASGITESSIRRRALSPQTDTTTINEELGYLQKSAGMLEQHNPKLLQKILSKYRY